MYLTGDLSYTDMLDYYVKVKEKITKEDLGKCKVKSSFQVINLRTLEYFDPESNSWKNLKTE